MWVPLNDLVHAAITVGKPGVAHLFTHGWNSISDIIIRTHTVYAYLQYVAGRYGKSSLYESLDPTEKAAASYFMGMISAKVVFDRLLKTPWLFHVSMLKPLGHSFNLKGKSEPDLVGKNALGEWVVAEAKGRSNGFNQPAMRAAKEQTRQLRTINGAAPALRVAIQASFEPYLRFDLCDPEDAAERAIDIETDLDTVMHRYYSGIIDATEGAEVALIQGRQFLVRKIEEVGVTVGLDTGVRYLRLFGLSGRIPALLHPPDAKMYDGDDPQNFRVYGDGVAIALDRRWSDNVMALSPFERREGFGN
ncbi:hypothetical protein [Panacagrimonas perspica]|uniref:hypothetical protein n=1 Tax=Panacagrimonas perspica TaxID=381431 RepID=UPI001446ADC6|nr:hypothetical protein [Panacagrimonas perspica]